MSHEDFLQFKDLVILQLRKLNIDVQEYDDFIQECWLYIMRRKNKVNIHDQYIYGDISNGIFNYLRKLNRYHNRNLLTYLEPTGASEDLIKGVIAEETIDELLGLEYGYLVLYNRIYGYSVSELSEYFGLSENKIYYEINKIISDLDWVIE